LILVDLDDFKTANDSFGPEVCDKVLCRVAQRLRTFANTASLIARVSGDGFAIVLQHASAAQALAEKCAEFVGRPYAISGHIVTIDTSMGIARAGDHGCRARDLLQAANLALHKAQADGGSRICCFEPGLLRLVQAHDALRIDFRAAVALQRVELSRTVVSQQFEVHYQPQIALADGRLTGFEALARWGHPVRGYVPPDQFIPLAEELGLIEDLGDWVLRAACRDAVLWPAPHQGAGLRVAVNVSPLQLRDGRALLRSIEQALSESGLPPSRLEIELTETALVGEIGDTLAAIRQLGVELALDDFGTGYSSLSRLSDFPFSRLKIDRSFVANLNSADLSTGKRSEKVIRAIAALGVAFELDTVVEGIETIEQMQIAQHAGYTEMQGYLVSRPVPRADVSGLIRRLQTEQSGKEFGHGA
jgi:diguanylate cyclase (GGDEF)-like protein